MANRRRQTEQFSMSFLDCMCCGFGAVILLFMIINSQIKQQNDQDQLISLDEVSSIRSQLLEERKNLVLAKSRLSRAENEEQTISDEITKLLILLNQIKAELEKNDVDSLAKTKKIEQLKSDIDKLNKEREEILNVTERLNTGDNLRSFTGDGDRQYLTGLKVGGKRILILVDSSASMLDRKIINIIRKNIGFKKINKDFENKLNSLNRQALHAKSLGFFHPKNNKFMNFETDLPKDYKEILDLLNKLSN